MSGKAIMITRKHYDAIIQKGRESLPKMTGGFLAGEAGIVKGIYPISNVESDQTVEMSFSQYYIEKALGFFKKHSLSPYGIYKVGVGSFNSDRRYYYDFIPAKKGRTLNLNDRYCFYFDLGHGANPLLSVYYYDATNKAHSVRWSILESGYNAKQLETPTHLRVCDEGDLMSKLMDMKSQSVTYDKEDGLDDSSSFRTLA